MSKCVIETKNLTKQYGTQKSVADLNIQVQKGRIYGLLGMKQRLAIAFAPFCLLSYRGL